MPSERVSLPTWPPESVPCITSLLIKPVSALCNLDCAYCFYLDRVGDPYQSPSARTMSGETLQAMIRKFLAYAHPHAVFAWQGGEPTVASPEFFEQACRLQWRYGSAGQMVSNSLQTNATLLNDRWCEVFTQYRFLLGVSLDGPEKVHDLYRRNKGGQGTWRQAMAGIELLQQRGVEFNILCVVSQANVRLAEKLYRFYRRLGIDHIQYIPLAEFQADGTPQPWSITPQQYGRFLLETFRLWWPNRRRVRIRLFDNIAESLAGLLPGNCALHQRCDSYTVVEYNGDVYPCDFFVRQEWKLGNVKVDSFDEIARRRKRFEFAEKKTLPRAECRECDYEAICHGGCPKLREGPRGRFDDPDYFCESYKMIFRKAVPPLRAEVQRIVRAQAAPGAGLN